MEELEIAKDVYAVAKPFVDPLIKTVLEPKLEQLKKWFQEEGVKQDLVDHTFNNKFEEYLLRTFQRSYFVNTIVFPNQQVRLDDLYYPARLINTRNYNRTDSNKIDSKFFNENTRILVSDYAGMGKSTLSKFLCKHIITQQMGIPIFIELRKLNKENTVLNELFNQINPIDKSFKERFILKLLVRGDFIILFDGFDEIPTASQEFVIDDLRSFVSKAPQNKFVLTSRPEASLSSFGDFQNFFIEPLNQRGAFSVIDNYDKINKIKVAKKLKNDITERQEQIEDFLTNPFLVSLLYKSYTYNKDIPTKRVTFFDEVYNALYKAHDLSKDGYKRPKKSKLDIQDFRVVLRDLAFSTAKLKEVEYTEQVLLNYIKESKDHCAGIDFKEREFLEDLLLTVPLIVRDGNKLKWAHKSIQDYFAAEFVCFHNKEEEILEKIYKSKNEAFLNILALIQELDNKTFRKVILLKILQDYVQYYDNSYGEFEQNQQVHLRKCLSYGVKMCFMRVEEEIGHNEARDIVKKEFPVLKDENFFSTLMLDTLFFRLSSFNFNRELLELLYGNIKYLLDEKIRYKTSREEKEIELCRQMNKPELVDDNKVNHLNSEENFEATTIWFMDALRRRRRFGGNRLFALDIEKSRNEIELIKEEIKKDNELNILEGI